MDERQKFNAWFPNEIHALLDKLAAERNSSKTQVVIDAIRALAENRKAESLPAEVIDALRELKEKLPALSRLEERQAALQKAIEEIRWMITKLK